MKLLFNPFLIFYANQKNSKKILSHQNKRALANKSNLILIRKQAENLFYQLIKINPIKDFGELLDQG